MKIKEYSFLVFMDKLMKAIGEGKVVEENTLYGDAWYEVRVMGGEVKEDSSEATKELNKAIKELKTTRIKLTKTNKKIKELTLILKEQGDLIESLTDKEVEEK